MNEILDPFVYKSKDKSPYSNRYFLQHLKKSFAQMVNAKRVSQEHFEYPQSKGESRENIVITQDSIQQYTKDHRHNQNNSVTRTTRKECYDFSLQCSPTNRQPQLPQIVITKKHKKSPQKKMEVNIPQNPQDCTNELQISNQITIQLPTVTKREIKEASVNRMNRHERFEQLMKFKHDDKIVELRQLVKNLQKPKRPHRKDRKVTFSINDILI